MNLTVIGSLQGNGGQAPTTVQTAINLPTIARFSFLTGLPRSILETINREWLNIKDAPSLFSTSKNIHSLFLCLFKASFKAEMIQEFPADWSTKTEEELMMANKIKLTLDGAKNINEAYRAISKIIYGFVLENGIFRKPQIPSSAESKVLSPHLGRVYKLLLNDTSKMEMLYGAFKKDPNEGNFLQVAKELLSPDRISILVDNCQEVLDAISLEGFSKERKKAFSSLTDVLINQGFAAEAKQIAIPKTVPLAELVRLKELFKEEMEKVRLYGEDLDSGKEDENFSAMICEFNQVVDNAETPREIYAKIAKVIYRKEMRQRVFVEFTPSTMQFVVPDLKFIPQLSRLADKIGSFIEVAITLNEQFKTSPSEENFMKLIEELLDQDCLPLHMDYYVKMADRIDEREKAIFSLTYALINRGFLKEAKQVAEKITDPQMISKIAGQLDSASCIQNCIEES
jgi:hypothetical protein